MTSVFNYFLYRQSLFTAATEEQKKIRFRHADTDKDDLLSENELNSMFHAQEKPHMHDVIYEVRSTLFSSMFVLCC